MGVFRQQKALDRLEDRLMRLENKADDTERVIRKLDLEFGDLYDKVKRQMSRMSKRAALDAKENEAPAELFSENNSAGGLDPISQSILLRRARGLEK